MTMPTSTEEDDNVRQPEARRYGSQFAVATMMVLGLTSTAAQFIAASTLGIAHLFSWAPMSTGGAVALIGGVFMWIKCPDWGYWRRWIWLWVGIVAIVAFIAMNFLARSSGLIASTAISPPTQSTETSLTIPAGYTDTGEGIAFLALEEACPSDDVFKAPSGLREHHGGGPRSCVVYSIYAYMDCPRPALRVDVLDSSGTKIDGAVTMAHSLLLPEGETASIEAQTWQPTAAYFQVSSGSCD